MRKLFGLVTALGLVMGAAQPAQAVVQSLASASLVIQLATLPPIPVPWNGTGSANVTATDVTGLTAGIFSYSGVIPVTDPSAYPIVGIQFPPSVTNGTGNFYGVDTGAGGGLMAVIGTANICVFGLSCAAPAVNVTVPFTTAGANGVGLGGLPITVFGAVNVTASGNGWTTGAVAIGSISVSGSPLAGNSVKLVTPTLVSTNIGTVVPLFGIMTLTFIPEPGTLLLLASGVAGLAMVGRKRMSK